MRYVPFFFCKATSLLFMLLGKRLLRRKRFCETTHIAQVNLEQAGVKIDNGLCHIKLSICPEHVTAYNPVAKQLFYFLR